MRKFAGVALAAAMLLPVGLIASPGGAAAAKPTCTALSGKATFKPPLPKLSSPKTVKAAIGITGAKLVGCAGGGVKTGVVGATLKFGIASNCASVAQGKPANIKGTLKIVWDTKATSTVTATLKGVSGNPFKQVVSGPISAGLFKNSKLTATTLFAIPKGQCDKTDLSFVTFTLVKGTKLVIK